MSSLCQAQSPWSPLEEFIVNSEYQISDLVWSKHRLMAWTLLNTSLHVKTLLQRAVLFQNWLLWGSMYFIPQLS